MPLVPEASSGRRGLLSQTSTPCDEIAGDPHVVVLEDEARGRASCSERDRVEDLLDDLLARSIGGVGLAGEDDLDGPLLVPQQPRQAVDVAEQQAGPLVGREPPSEADRQDVRVERTSRRSRGRPAPRRGGRTGCAAGRARRSPARSFWRWCASHSSSSGMLRRAAPRSGPARSRASRSSRSAPRCAASVSPIAWPSQVGMWTPLVTPRIGRGDDARARSRWRSRRGAG